LSNFQHPLFHDLVALPTDVGRLELSLTEPYGIFRD